MKEHSPTAVDGSRCEFGNVIYFHSRQRAGNEVEGSAGVFARGERQTRARMSLRADPVSYYRLVPLVSLTELHVTKVTSRSHPAGDIVTRFFCSVNSSVGAAKRYVVYQLRARHEKSLGKIFFAVYKLNH
jgi:hypothetical protein